MHGLKLLRGSIALLVVLAACSDTDTGGVDSTARALTAAGATGMVRCATIEPGVIEQDAADAAASDLTLLRAPGARRQIPVYFHIVISSAGEGDVSELVPAQVDVLNSTYAPAGFRFRLAAIEVTQSDVWYEAAADTPEEQEMKQALHRGHAGTLNVYTGINDGSLLGWATFPFLYSDQPQMDGVVVFNLTLPGGGLEIPVDPADEPDGIINYSGGDSLTHETGHWLGLFHTFQDGCTLRNDRIDDTPAEAEPQFLCVDRDSCTGRKFPGTDPIHNFMDYADDDCMDQFTADQEERMQRQFDAFRG